MEASDAGILAGIFGVMMALVKLAEVAIKTAIAKRNGSSASTADHLIDIVKEQLSVLRALEREVSAIRGDLRAASIEQSHLQKTVDALHLRMDSLTPGRLSPDERRSDIRG